MVPQSSLCDFTGFYFYLSSAWCTPNVPPISSSPPLFLDLDKNIIDENGIKVKQSWVGNLKRT